MKFSHYAFSDDSKHEDGRYNSLALITLKQENYNYLNEQLEEILKECGIRTEFKWKKLKNVEYSNAAEKMIEFVFKNQNLIGIDVLIWDLEDSRHRNLKGRDDSENLVRMYYHLVSTTLSKRWPIHNSLWKWYPDQQSSVNWEKLKECINNKKHICVADLFRLNTKFENVRLIDIEPSDSNEYPFIQLADLFSGMGAYSFGHFDKFKRWQKQEIHQLSLYQEENQKFSNSEEVRFKIMELLNEKCKKLKLRISLDSAMGFISHVPTNFINFWLYKPQHPQDKAPKRSKLGQTSKG